MKLSHPKGEASAELQRKRKVNKAESISNDFELKKILRSETRTRRVVLTKRELRFVRATVAIMCIEWSECFSLEEHGLFSGLYILPLFNVAVRY